MKDYLILDIETLARPREELDRMMPEFEPPGNVKDPAKVAAAIAAKRVKWLADAALDATTGRIAILGTLTRNGAVMLRADVMSEARMLTEFWRMQDAADVSVIVGHNLRNFDMPFIIRRSFMNGLGLPLGILHKNRLTERFVDTMEMWGAGERNAMISLDALARALGVGGKTGSGGDFSALWEADKERAVEYCAHDLELTRQVAERMGL
ncbi:MAG: 3'-5' exonuclease [Verrucomicrobiia bacterium]